MKLSEYMHSHLISDIEFSKKLGVTRQSVWHWRSKEAVPRDKIKKEIQLLTGGKVPVSSWFED